MKKLKTLIANIKFLMLVDLRDRLPERPIVTVNFNELKNNTGSVNVRDSKL